MENNGFTWSLPFGVENIFCSMSQQLLEDVIQGNRTREEAFVYTHAPTPSPTSAVGEYT